ncbi:MAG: PilN domain-containing protein [Rhodocyclaceae bacterium]|nr:PilN domain-containing protein [Rhodocyclaceae bacterium]
MMRINLLPHRAERKRVRQMQFAALSVISLVLGAVLVGIVHVTLTTQIAYQDRRNEYLKKEIAILDKQNDEIKKLREQNHSLLARKETVEKLQSNRSDAVHLMDQMLRILPDGVHLKTIRQTGSRINIVGYAQSNARISTLMRAIEDSPWLDSPALVEIHASSANGGRISEFTLAFNLTKPLVAIQAATTGIKN